MDMDMDLFTSPSTTSSTTPTSSHHNNKPSLRHRPSPPQPNHLSSSSFLSFSGHHSPPFFNPNHSPQHHLITPPHSAWSDMMAAQQSTVPKSDLPDNMDIDHLEQDGREDTPLASTVSISTASRSPSPHLDDHDDQCFNATPGSSAVHQNSVQIHSSSTPSIHQSSDHLHHPASSSLQELFTGLDAFQQFNHFISTHATQQLPDTPFKHHQPLTSDHAPVNRVLLLKQKASSPPVLSAKQSMEIQNSPRWASGACIDNTHLNTSFTGSTGSGKLEHQLTNTAAWDTLVSSSSSNNTAATGIVDPTYISSFHTPPLSSISNDFNSGISNSGANLNSNHDCVPMSPTHSNLYQNQHHNLDSSTCSSSVQAQVCPNTGSGFANRPFSSHAPSVNSSNESASLANYNLSHPTNHAYSQTGLRVSGSGFTGNNLDKDTMISPVHKSDAFGATGNMLFPDHKSTSCPTPLSLLLSGSSTNEKHAANPSATVSKKPSPLKINANSSFSTFIFNNAPATQPNANHLHGSDVFDSKFNDPDFSFITNQPAANNTLVDDSSCAASDRKQFRNKRPKKVPRPENSYFLYRRSVFNIVKTANPTLSNPNISKIISDMWRNESDEVKSHYKDLSIVAKEEHLKQYPDYKYQPRRKSKTGPAGFAGKRKREAGELSNYLNVSENDKHTSESMGDGRKSVPMVSPLFSSFIPENTPYHQTMSLGSMPGSGHRNSAQPSMQPGMYHASMAGRTSNSKGMGPGNKTHHYHHLPNVLPHASSSFRHQPPLSSPSYLASDGSSFRSSVLRSSSVSTSSSKTGSTALPPSMFGINPNSTPYLQRDSLPGSHSHAKPNYLHPGHSMPSLPMAGLQHPSGSAGHRQRNYSADPSKPAFQEALQHPRSAQQPAYAHSMGGLQPFSASIGYGSDWPMNPHTDHQLGAAMPTNPHQRWSSNASQESVQQPNSQQFPPTPTAPMFINSNAAANTPGSKQSLSLDPRSLSINPAQFGNILESNLQSGNINLDGAYQLQQLHLNAWNQYSHQHGMYDGVAMAQLQQQQQMWHQPVGVGAIDPNLFSASGTHSSSTGAEKK